MFTTLQSPQSLVVTHELILVDGLCAQIGELIPGALQELVALGQGGNPLQQITQELARRRRQGQPVDTLHLVAHGRPGGFQIGGQWINAASLISQADQLAQWQVGTIALWSCEVGGDHNFVALLEELTGSDVLSSEHTLGRNPQGANWELVSRSGARFEIPFSETARQQASVTLTQAPYIRPWGIDDQVTSNAIKIGTTLIYSFRFSDDIDAGSFTASDLVNAGTATVTFGTITEISPGLFTVEVTPTTSGTIRIAIETGSSILLPSPSAIGVDTTNRIIDDTTVTAGTTPLLLAATRNSFAALKSDGSVITWGDSSSGGNSSTVATLLGTNVVQIFSTGYAFAALKSDGSVITWGNSFYGGNSSTVASSLTSNVVKVFSTGFAFAALKSDGSVITWGDSFYGGNSLAVAANLKNVVQIFSTSSAFAALKSDGSVITWGDSRYGNFGGDSSAIATNLNSVVQIFSNERAFAALKSDGSVVTWGNSTYGGNSSAVAANLNSVVQIFSNGSSFAALKSDGSVITWGTSAM